MDTPDFSLAGQVAVVTGASRGLGRGIAEAFADAGATVALVARNTELLDAVASEITDAGGEAGVFELDVSDVEAIPGVFEDVRSRYGSLDVLVNSAGLGNNLQALDVTPAAWDEVMAVNLRGLFFCCQAAGRLMIDAGHGRIVNISSQAGIVGIREHAVYSSTKGGVNTLTKVLALEWSSLGVTVNAVAPTYIYTPMTAGQLDDPTFRQSVLDRLPIGRLGSITDVAGAVVYLASPAGAMVTGHILPVDGGWTAQ